MKSFFTALVMAALASPAVLAQNYISDDLFTYMHSGPGSEYRILGSVNAGTEINIVSKNPTQEYVQIEDSRGRKGWVESKYVTNTPSLKTRFPALEAELLEVKTKLATAQSDTKAKTQGLIESLDLRNSQLKELEQYTSDLNQKLIDAQAELRELTAKLDTQKDDLLMHYFAYGGMVAGGGLLFGLLLPHIVPSRKKRQNGWA